jgi:CheY-like chemotaxis protein
MPNGKAKEIVILLAEDDDGHAELIREHLEQAGVRNRIERFKDGQDLWDFLDAHGRNGGAYLILLDIRMPRMDGIELLRRIKVDAALSSIPVIMLTTTDDPREVEACYSLGCNCYVNKPIDFASFTETLTRLGLFIMIMRVGEIHDSHS